VSELVATRIREHAERLRLAHLGENLDTLVTRAEQATMGYLEFVDLLLEEEVGVREGRRFRNALKLSGLPHHKGLDEFDFAFQPDLDARKVRDLACRCQLFRSRHATCEYSWINPPSRPRRTTRPAGTKTAGSSGPSGGACPKARCGRWTL